jgi:hypothetical protein
MNNKKLRRILPIILLAFLIISPLAHADLYWESIQVTKGVPGQSDGTKNVKNYLTESASRMDMGDQIMIMNFDSMKMYQIDPEDMTCTETDMNEIGKMPEMGAEEAQAMQQMQEMMQKMMSSIQIIPTNETQNIAGYQCRKYNVTFMMTTSEYWASKEVEGYEELKVIGKKTGDMFKGNPMLKQMNVAGMMDQLDGFPVKTVVNIMGGTVTTTLKSIQKKSLSKDLFAVPKGYTLKKGDPLE